MAEITTIPLLNAQEQGMSIFAAAQATRPEMAQATIQELALNLLKEQTDQVQKPEDSAKSSTVSSEDGSRGECHDAGERRKRQRKPEPETMEPSASPDPLIGNLLNLKI